MNVEICKNCKHMVLSSLPEANEFNEPFCTLNGYPCDMIKICEDKEEIDNANDKE